MRAARGWVSGATALTVTAATLVSMAVAPANPSIPKGATEQFTVTGSYTDGSTQNLTNSATWTSLNPLVATISNSGLATGLAPGSTTIQAASGSVSGSTALTVTVPPLQITISGLPAGQAQVSYSAALAASGGVPPYSWTVFGGQLPNSLSLASPTGIISGTPTLAGAFTFSIQVSDSAGTTASAGFTINIAPAQLNSAAPFTVDPATAMKLGTHEIVLTGNGSVANPFDTVATVTFTPPSGGANAVTVRAFYDGGSTWRARVYVTEAGTWQWTSSSAADAALNGKSGSFAAVDSNLRGLLKKDSRN